MAFSDMLEVTFLSYGKLGPLDNSLESKFHPKYITDRLKQCLPTQLVFGSVFCLNVFNNSVMDNKEKRSYYNNLTILSYRFFGTSLLNLRICVDLNQHKCK